MGKSIQLALILFLLAPLSSCSLFTPKPVAVDIQSTAIARAPLNLEDSDPISLDKLPWVIITKENQAEVFAKLEKEGIDPVLMGLTDSGYEAGTVNNQKVMNLIKQLKKTIESYKKYYEPKKP